MDQRDEFISEAQEIIEGLSRDLLAIDGASRNGGLVDPELINDTFRAVHTLKGLAGLFNVARMSTLSHHLEDILDDVRLGRSVLTPSLLDLLFRAVEVYGRILSSMRHAEPEPGLEVDALIALLDASGQGPSSPTSDPIADFELDPGLLTVLTEYEEHRLRTNLANGMGLYRLRVRFGLATIDRELDELKAKAKPVGEIVTYLPSTEASDSDAFELDVLLASMHSIDEVRATLGAPGIVIDAIGRRHTPTRLPPRPSSPSASVSGLDDDGVPTPSPAVVSIPEVLRTRDDDPVHVESTGMSIRGVAQTVRVDIRKLDHLMNIVAELAIVRSALGRVTDKVRGVPELRDLGIEMHRLHRSLERHLGEMQAGILEVRMVPLGQVFDKLARVVRQLGREQGKDINLVITGAETEVDKLIVEELSDPLVHMIRNAIDHGIETRAVRADRGKPEAGTIALNAYQKGNHVVIEVQDDGAGIDEDRVLSQAIRRGLVTEADSASLLPREIFGFIFLPGFSTKEGVDELSGRGVGMDIVKTNIGKIGGVIDVQSEFGTGTRMTITLPITLAILSALVVVVAGRRYALP
ncbi:MAG: chemotaxis protein CheA, partial [Polyangiales bacterium]